MALFCFAILSCIIPLSLFECYSICSQSKFRWQKTIRRTFSRIKPLGSGNWLTDVMQWRRDRLALKGVLGSDSSAADPAASSQAATGSRQQLKHNSSILSILASFSASCLSLGLMWGSEKHNSHLDHGSQLTGFYLLRLPTFFSGRSGSCRKHIISHQHMAAAVVCGPSSWRPAQRTGDEPKKKDTFSHLFSCPSVGLSSVHCMFLFEFENGSKRWYGLSVCC